MTQPGKQPGQPYPQLPSRYPEIKPLPPGWQQPIIMNPDGTYRIIKDESQSTATDYTSNKWYLYLIPAIGAPLLVLGIFLPWLSINFLGTGISINGVGGVSAPPGFVDGMQKVASDFQAIAPPSTSTSSTSAPPFEPRDGWILLALAVVVFFLAIGGMSQRSRVYSFGISICGAACTALAGIDLWQVTKAIDDLYKSVANPTANLFAGFQAGFGLYLVVAAGFIILIGSTLTIFLFKPEIRQQSY